MKIIKKRPKHIHVLPNVITAFGLSCGLFVIFKMAMVPNGTLDYNGALTVAGVLLLACLADALDGAVARAIKAESYFGGIFDSLSDAITFGVCPSIVVIKSLSAEPKTEISFFLISAAMIYSVCGVLRLARFSVQAKQAQENPDLLKDHKKNFTGLPIPAAAGAIVSATLVFYSPELKSLFTLSKAFESWILIAMLVVVGYLMVSRLKFPSQKNLHIRVASFRMVFLFVVSAVLLLYGLISYFAVVFFLSFWGYICVSLVFFLMRIIFGHKSKTLEEYEPDPTDIIESESVLEDEENFGE